MTEPLLSVIVPTRDRKDLLAAMLEALDRVTAAAGELEVIVVDDGSTDGTAEWLDARRGPFPLRVVRIERPAGPAAARNRGAAEARGEVLGFLDSDVLVHPGWWQAAKPHFTDPRVAAVEGATGQPPGSPRPTPFTNLVVNLDGRRYLTCNILYRRSVFLEHGGFDERFKLADREDTDLAFTVLEHGGQVRFEPKCRVDHPVFGENPGLHFKKARYGVHEALLRRKHPRLYRTHLKWVDGRAFPVFYWGLYLGALAAVLGAVLGSMAWLALGANVCLLGWAGSVYALCRKRRVSPGAFLRLAAQMCWVPWLRLYWVLRGEWTHRRVKPDAAAA
jgi:glycosyltransferase involved in cell wall biosynthesis